MLGCYQTPTLPPQFPTSGKDSKDLKSSKPTVSRVLVFLPIWLPLLLALGLVILFAATKGGPLPTDTSASSNDTTVTIPSSTVTLDSATITSALYMTSTSKANPTSLRNGTVQKTNLIAYRSVHTVAPRMTTSPNKPNSTMMPAVQTANKTSAQFTSMQTKVRTGTTTTTPTASSSTSTSLATSSDHEYLEPTHSPPGGHHIVRDPKSN